MYIDNSIVKKERGVIRITIRHTVIITNIINQPESIIFFFGGLMFLDQMWKWLLILFVNENVWILQKKKHEIRTQSCILSAINVNS